MRFATSLLLLLQFSCAQAEPAARAGAYRILALGDSYTIGESVPVDERWPVELAKLLRARGIDAAEPQIIARTGWTTDELNAAIDAAGPKGPFDLVTLLIGVNNQFRGRSAGEYEKEFPALLDRAIGFAGGKPDRVVVVSIPDWGAMPVGQGFDRLKVAREIDAFNAINRRISSDRKVRYVDVTDVSRGVTTQPVLGAEDGLHPSGQQYKIWAQRIDKELASPVK